MKVDAENLVIDVDAGRYMEIRLSDSCTHDIMAVDGPDDCTARISHSKMGGLLTFAGGEN
jgi:hypothetical protein